MFKNKIKSLTLQELETKKGTKEWDLFWKHIYNVMVNEEHKKLEMERKKELAKKKNKR